MKKLLILIPLIISFAYSATLLPTNRSKNMNIDRRLHSNNIDNKLLNQAIFLETNNQRIKHGVKPLKFSPFLSNVSQYHSNDMVKNNFLGHKSSKGKPFSKRMKMNSVPGGRLSENCALSFGIEYDSKSKIRFNGKGNFKKNGKKINYRTYRGAAKNIVTNLMNSAGHRKNILDKKVNNIGIATSFYKKSSFNDILSIKTTQIFSR